MLTLSVKHIATIKDASKKLTGPKRRAFQAQVSIDYLESNPRLAERVFGWDRNTVELGLHELRTGITCADDFKARGNKKMEEKMQQLEVDICCLAEQIRLDCDREASHNLNRWLDKPDLPFEMNYAIENSFLLNSLINAAGINFLICFLNRDRFSLQSPVSFSFLSNPPIFKAINSLSPS